MEMEPVPNCPVCGKEGTPWGGGTEIKIKSVEYVQYDICQSCDNIYQNPRMTREAMELYYREGEYHRNFDLNPCHNRADYHVIMLTILGLVPKRRILDVGCATGYLLWTLKNKFNVEVLGLDYLVDHSLLEEIVSSKEEVSGKFGLIISSHQLEHVYDPLEELLWMRDKLEPYGSMFLEVPTVHKMTMPHTYIFSRKAIDILMMKAGLKYLYIGQEFACQIVAQREEEAGQLLQPYTNVFNEIEKPVYLG